MSKKNKNRNNGNNKSVVNNKVDNIFKRMMSKVGKVLTSKIMFTLNLVLLLVNIVLPIYREIIQKPIVDNNITLSTINITKEYPFFDTKYLEIESSTFSNLSLRKPMQDSLFTDEIKNYYVANADILKLGDFDGNSSVVALAIRQIGGSIAKDVTVDYICVHAENGLDYYTTTPDDVLQMDAYDYDVKGKRTTNKRHSVRYGNIVPGRGLILPLFEIDNFKAREEDFIDSDGDEDEVWSITGKTLLVPITLHYGNIYDDSVKSIDIRKMNNSSIIYSLYIEGRG